MVKDLNSIASIKIKWKGYSGYRIANMADITTSTNIPGDEDTDDRVITRQYKNCATSTELYQALQALSDYFYEICEINIMQTMAWKDSLRVTGISLSRGVVSTGPTIGTEYFTIVISAKVEMQTKKILCLNSPSTILYEGGKELKFRDALEKLMRLAMECVDKLKSEN